MMPYDNNDNQGNSCKLKINKEIYIYIYIFFFFSHLRVALMPHSIYLIMQQTILAGGLTKC